MKKYILFPLVFIGLLFSCGGGSDDSVIDPDPGTGGGGGATENKAPSVPSLTDPTNNKLCIDNNLVFNWSASTDPDGDAVKYALEVSKNVEFTQITHAFTNLTSLTKTILLDRAQVYYWRVKTTDSKSKSSAYSSVFQFYTEGYGVENHLPFSPSLVLPGMDATVGGTSVELIWGATDVDGDDLTFDVYMDMNSNPTTAIATGHSSNSLIVSALAAGTTYYWKVVAKDGKGGVTIGQVWSLKTE
jgi:hypothetical protein